MTLRVTRHAIERYQERVANVPDARVLEALQCRACQLADRIGAPFVRLGGGQRAVLKDHAIVTVLPPDIRLGSLDRRRQPDG